MILNNIMEENQLDFNQPLLSVRRFSSVVSIPEAAGAKYEDRPLLRIPPIPAYRSELKSGPVCHPGTVPFLWEQMPGRPKNERKTQEGPSSEHPPIPKLPPGKVIHDKQRQSKVEMAEQCQMDDEASTFQIVSSLNKHRIIEKRSRDELCEKGGSSSDDEEAFLDALDSLSRTESFLNCSINGLSGVDGAEVKSSGTIAAELQTRNFMMDRFLPAAKAMASELPESATRKQLVAKRPKEVDQVVTKFERNTVQQRRRMLLLHHMQNEVKESDDESDDYEEPDYLSAKLCGLLPQLCLKGSFSMMNPAQGLRVQAGVKKSSVHTAQAKTNYRSSCCRNETELPVDSAHQQRSRGGSQRNDLHGNKLNQQSDHQRSDESSYRSIMGSGVSSCPSQTSQAFKKNVSSNINKSAETAELSRENGVNSHRKRRSSFRELLAIEPDKCEKSPIYTANTTPPRNSISSVSSTKKGTINYKGDDFDTLVKNEGTANNSSSHGTELNLVDANMSPSPKTLSSESTIVSPMDLNQEMQTDATKISFPQPNLLQDSTILNTSQLPDDGKIGFDDKLPQEANKRSFHALSSKLSLPPLPKSPSESWLHRTLPAASIKNSSSRSSTGAGNVIKIQASKAPLVPKWEIMVRTSNTHNNHMLFSEEGLTAIPED